MTVKFNTFLVLMKDLEYVVRNATNTWRNVYYLHKLSDQLVEIKDDDDDSDKDEDFTQFVMVDYQELMKDDEEEKEEEAIEEAKEGDEKIDLVKIVAVVIASLSN